MSLKSIKVTLVKGSTVKFVDKEEKEYGYLNISYELKGSFIEIWYSEILKDSDYEEYCKIYPCNAVKDIKIDYGR